MPGVLPEPVEAPITIQEMQQLDAMGIPQEQWAEALIWLRSQPPPPPQQAGPSRQPTPPWVRPPTMSPASMPPAGQFVNPFSMSNPTNLPPPMPMPMRRR